jgi:hypothetical protein
MNAKIELDTAEFEDEGFQTWLHNAGISSTVLDPWGPGGGCPVVEYVGSKEALSDMIDIHFCSDEDYLKSLIETI